MLLLQGNNDGAGGFFAADATACSLLGTYLERSPALHKYFGRHKAC